MVTRTELSPSCSVGFPEVGDLHGRLRVEPQHQHLEVLSGEIILVGIRQEQVLTFDELAG